MQTRNPLLNDFAELMTDAFGAAQAVGDEARTAMRAQADRFIADMDLVSREEFDVVKAALATAREEIETLNARLAALETAGAAKPAARKRKPAAKSATPKSTD
ncbi:accessory factor UbiK family protein [Maricaulis salignorans]|uniref:BMFP domain-containing protein YqiC n=1 Tax=Maricaulis salignorans TaxID=144026 RepID=A0A1G9MSC9_9PROT|nr:accessory factor UbiK family protein [Maricaulis salignorans]SDL76901.1 BMFP domain-containing protein YqiC [Maricaulis salignorans]